MPKTLIIGMGISAVAFLQSMNRTGDDHVTTAGGPELWQRVGGDHKMGQPTPLLTGNLLSGPRKFDAPPVPGQNFMLARDFARLLDEHLRAKSQVSLPGDWVENIARAGSEGYLVSIKQGKSSAHHQFDKVIIAVGPGPARPLMAGDDGKLAVDVQSMGGHVIGGTEFMSPTWTMPGKGGAGIVAVYGGSATAAWAVELAILRRMHVTLWFTRSGEGKDAWNVEKRFSEAFPPGERNTGVERETKDVRKVLKLKDVRFHKLKIASSFVMLELLDEHGTTVLHPVDLLVYALGSAHAADAGLRQMLAKDIQDNLVPFYDRNFAISSKPALLGVGMADRSLMIVGSAMSSSGGFNLDKLFGKLDGEEQALIRKLAPYRDISESLPPAARPTEGIAMVMAGIEALNTFMPATPAPGGRQPSYNPPKNITAMKTGPSQLDRGAPNPAHGQPQTHALDFKWDINFNTSNRTQLAAYLAQTTDLTPLAANLAVALIVRLRAQARNPLGLTNGQVNFIIQRADWFADAQQKYNQNIDQRRKEYDHRWGADWYLNVLVDLMTQDPNQVSYWQKEGIHCDKPR